MSGTWDPDIAATDLSPGEKDGLQVYRNYTRAFEAKRISNFVAACDAQPINLADLAGLLAHLKREDARTLPVIACAYADDVLKDMYSRELPQDLIGGRAQMLNGFGPLARLSQRIQAAHAFGWLSADLLREVDLLRGLRNALSHNWDLVLLEAKMADLIANRQFALEERLADGSVLPQNFHAGLDQVQKLRVRLIWLMGRLRYETAFWVPALKQQLKPEKAIYGVAGAPKLLGRISELCLATTYEVCGHES